MPNTNRSASERRRSPLNLTPEDKVLFPFAHPDDEILEAALMGLVLARGIHVSTATATYGTESSKGSPDIVKTGGRRKEVEGSFGYIGVPAKNQHFFELDDGELDTAHNYTKLVHYTEQLLRDQDISAVVTFGAVGDDYHPDHLAVQRATIQAVANLGGKVAVWGLNTSHNGKELIGFGKNYKRRVAEFHHSQFFANPGDFNELAQYGPVVTSYESYDRVELPEPAYAILAK